MRKELPVRPNLEHLKSQAKDLLDASRRKDREALERFRDALPAARGANDERLAAMELALHDAQSVIAREYGFASWAELRARVEAATLSPETLRAMMEPHLSSPLPSEVQEALLAAAAEPQPREAPLVSPLPLLPLRNAALAVGAVAPLSVGRAASLAAVEAARNGGEMLAIFSQKNEMHEAPSEADLHPVGCAARLVSVFSTDRGTWIVVRATQWIRLEAIERTEPYGVVRVAPFTLQEEDTAETKQLVQALRDRLRDRLRAMIAALPDPEHVHRLTERMTARELADATIANLPCSVEDKARYASEPSLVARLEYLLALVDRAA
jgi:Lon protease-like protein